MRPPGIAPVSVRSSVLALASCLGLGTGGCAWSAGGLAVPESLARSPDEAPGAAEVAAARRLAELGRPREALEAVRRVLERFPEQVDGHRLRQDLLRERGRSGLVLWESEQRLLRFPRSAIAHYLRGRVVPTAAEKLAVFRRAVELDPRSFWPWLGLAFAWRSQDPERAVAIYRRLLHLSGGHPLAAIGLAGTLRLLGRTDEAEVVYAALRIRRSMPGVGDLGIAETRLQEGDRRAAWPPLLRALQLRPWDAGARDLLQQVVAAGVPDGQVRQVLDVLAVPEQRARRFARGDGASVLAALLLRDGDPFEARRVLEASRRREPLRSQRRRLWRRILLACGDVAAWLRDVREDFPQFLLEDETNEVRGRWVRLLEGPWSRAVDPLASAAMATDLVGALLHAGLLDEAVRVGHLARWRHGGGKLDRLLAEARAELAFERAMRRVLYRGYAGGRRRPDLDRVLAELRRISLETFGRDVVGEPRRFSIPAIGELVDPFDEGLGAHLARYNRHLVLGQRAGRPAEGLVLTRLCVRRLPDDPDLPLPAPCREVIGENRSIRSFSGVHGGDLAGVALVNHYVVDLDAVRDWALDLRERRRVARDQDGGAVLRDPVPRVVDDLQPVDVRWRLTLASPVPDADLEAAVLEMVRLHERAHLVDSFYFLPPESNLWRVLGLLLRHGFRPSAIEAELEARAELATLALARYPRLALAHVAGFLEDGAGGVHARGFRRLARRLVEALRADGAADARVSRWHELRPDRVRRIARELLGRQW